ncbi:MAG TPA: glucose-1-phosphate cytidylyltransferase [Longimicrobiales bacterium]|nr:glucose-1-phosphate cytidylyltransferase [Longimicrobiales bacterium]
MNVVILAGGAGTRLAEETELRPKPLVSIGTEPILWHIMRGYAHYGFNDFYVALGYKGDMIKQYFVDRCRLSGHLLVDLRNGAVEQLEAECEDWRVHLIDTGLATMTGGRVRRLERYLRPGGTFMLTYGDGVSNLDLRALLAFHQRHGKLATLTAVRPPSRFGGIVFDGDMVAEFSEKPQIGEGWINGGFMVLEPGVFDYLSGDDDVFETTALERLAEDGQLAAYRHDDFWQCMDVVRDRKLLERLWQEGTAPWQVWSRPATDRP